MAEFEFIANYNYKFLGRESELSWLDAHLLDPFRRSFTGLNILGSTGVGKTALVRYWLGSRRHSSQPLWVDISSELDMHEVIDRFTNYLYEHRQSSDVIVVLDSADSISDTEQYESVISKIFNFKRVRSLIFIAQSLPSSRRAETLRLEPFPFREATQLLHELSSNDLTKNLESEIIAASKGYPLAIQILAEAIKSGNPTALRSLLNNSLYDLSQTIAVPSGEIKKVIVPQIVIANDNLVNALKKRPADIHTLSPRKFEELLTELLVDMGWDVELTQQTRDGGKDILAYLNTDLGRILCLVEAKHYRPDRKVGVDLVRTLYGTLCDAQANSAMLVTSSSFTSDAKEFQQKHEYQLNLRDYADIVNWVMKYKEKDKFE